MIRASGIGIRIVQVLYLGCRLGFGSGTQLTETRRSPEQPVLVPNGKSPESRRKYPNPRKTYRVTRQLYKKSITRSCSASGGSLVVVRGKLCGQFGIQFGVSLPRRFDGAGSGLGRITAGH
eukprot:scaffold538943_cov17-Prasinocladus_malaysianus.AAC.1